ncbi:MAG: DUF973 family protein [Thermoplasmata archaeon]
MTDNVSWRPSSGGKAEKEIQALHSMSVSALIAIAGYIFELAILVFVLAFSGGVKHAVSISPPSRAYAILSAFLIRMSIVVVIGTLLILVSFVFLRSGYKILKAISAAFDTPYIGINIFFIGIILDLIGYLMIVVGSLPPSFLLVFGVVVVVVGAVTCLLGEILGLIMGMFNEKRFSTSGIAYIVGIFTVVFSIIGAVPLYKTSRKVLRGLSSLEPEGPISHSGQ